MRLRSPGLRCGAPANTGIVLRRLFACGGIDLHHPDSSPEGAERQPPPAGSIHGETRIDGAIVVSRLGTAYDPLIHPASRRGCRAGGQTYGRDVLSECGRSIVEPVRAVVVRDIRRPQIALV